MFDNSGAVSCTACHNKHGGQFEKLLDNTVYYHFTPVTPPGTCNLCHMFTVPSPATGNNNTFCFQCHEQNQADVPNGYPATEADRSAPDNGYFALRPTTSRFAVRWPGQAAFQGSTSPHGTTATSFSGFDGVSRGVSDCKTCHDVHGTANQYNVLRDTYRAGNYTFCFRCHGLSGSPAGTDNVARYFPTGSGGLSTAPTGTTNVGHNVKTAGGYLASGNSLPCYDCHVTHGSANGNTQLKSDQRWTSLGNTKYGSTPSDNAADNASRIFCLGCHVASDDAATTGMVENLQRQTAGANKLKLPTTNTIVEHTSAWAGNGCQRCHYGRN